MDGSYGKSAITSEISNDFQKKFNDLILMKRLLSFLFFISSYMLSFGQVTRIDTVSYKPIVIPTNSQKSHSSDFLYSIAVRSFALEQFPRLLDQTANEHFFSSAFNGLMFKFNDNQISYRISGAHYNNDISINSSCNNCEDINGKLINTTIKIGFEKNLTYTRIQPYFGIDLGYSNQKYTSDEDALNRTIDRKNAALASPFIGVKLNILPFITVSAESNMTVAYSFQKTERNQFSEIPSSNITDKKRWEYFFAPVGILSLQFNFGSLY